MILICTQFVEDVSVQRLSAVLRTRGAEPVILAPTMLEEPSSLLIASEGERGVRTILQLQERAIPLDQVHAAWLWRGWYPEPLDPRFRGLAQRRAEWAFFAGEWAAFHKGFSTALAYRHVFCVNPPPFNVAFEEKCCQLMLAAEVGLRIPPTLYTTRLPVAREFLLQHGDALIYKPFRPYIQMMEPEGDQPSRVSKLLTNRVQAADLVEGAGFIPTPGIFQPYVEKRLELRIVVVGRQLFACAIHSQQSERSRDDWRRYDLDHTPYERYDLPPEVADQILALMDRLGLVFGSIDMILTPEGEYVFLEVNPNGQFDWIANLTGLPIYEHLAAMLLAGSVDYAVTASAEAPNAA
jgi:glutathione synthase/RimK-type ligase-like ATP-grasp enzyme